MNTYQKIHMKNFILILTLIPFLAYSQTKKPNNNLSKNPKTNSNLKSSNSNQLIGNQFEYDAVGNVTKDLTQGISLITYQHISAATNSYYLPKEIFFVDGRKIVTNYDGGGTKLWTRYFDKNGVQTLEYMYVMQFTFVKVGNGESKLHEINIGDGARLVKEGNEFKKEFDIKDHTGTPRVTFKANNNNQLEVVQKQDFDPFGNLLEGIDQKNTTDTLRRKYFFNGKEYLVTVGLKMYDYGKRQYNPRLGRFYQVDPMAEKMPYISPYAFSFNNPLRYRDYDGQIPYPITIRSFATQPTFGGGFHGDNRGFSTSSNVTARVTQNIAYDTDKNYLKTSTWSDISSHPLLGEARATPRGGINSYSKTSLTSGVNRSDFSTSYAGANPLTPVGSPNINVESIFSITANSNKNTLSVRGVLSGDNFPSTEAFIKDPSGNSVFLGTGNAVGNPFTSLRGENNNRPISDFNVIIQLDKKGNFSGVSYDGTKYSVSDWNKKFEQSNTNNR